MRAKRTVAVVTMVMALGAACGSGDGVTGERSVLGDAEPAPAIGATPEVSPPVVEAVPEVRPVADAPRLPAVQELEQPAIWPAADVVFATPEEAAADFVRSVLISDGEPDLGEFRAGDSRSGEIVVFFPGEGAGSERQERGLLSLRQLTPSDGWFVIGASSPGATITSPAAGGQVAAGPVTVEGEARGFEATVVVTAFPAGDVGAAFDQQITRGGAFADVEPYRSTVDLTGAASGQPVAILVQGDTGLGSDPGDFAAIPVVVGATIPATR